MQNKLHYTDPLKAAWMAREFGVNFEKDEDTYAKITINTECFVMLHSQSKPFYIHPDSYHIFEPMEGDLLQWMDAETFTPLVGTLVKDVEEPSFEDSFIAFDIWSLVVGDDNYSILFDDIDERSIAKYLQDNTFIPIQRDNKAFFAPEAENAE